MKILSEHSPFKFLPLEMNEYERLIFDAIRITFEMIEGEYESLCSKLECLSINNSKKEKTSQIFSHAWGVIDHTSRLIKLFQKLVSESNHKILEPILQANTLRNTIQHLHERIDESIYINKSQFYGILVWYYKDLLNDKTTPIILYSGINCGGEIKFTIPDFSNFKHPINSISLQTVDKKKKIALDLSDLIQNLKLICVANEQKIEDFFISQGWPLYDWTMHKDIMISLKSEDNHEF